MLRSNYNTAVEANLKAWAGVICRDTWICIDCDLFYSEDSRSHRHNCKPRKTHLKIWFLFFSWLKKVFSESWGDIPSLSLPWCLFVFQFSSLHFELVRWSRIAPAWFVQNTWLNGLRNVRTDLDWLLKESGLIHWEVPDWETPGWWGVLYGLCASICPCFTGIWVSVRQLGHVY